MRRALLFAVALALAQAPAVARDTWKGDQDAGAAWRILNLLPPLTAGEPLRRGDMPGSGLPCVLVYTGTLGSLFRCATPADIPGATGTPNTVAWFNGSGLLNSLALAPEFQISGGTLSLAQNGATPGQLLGWSGSAWIPIPPPVSGVASVAAGSPAGGVTVAGTSAVTVKGQDFRVDVGAPAGGTTNDSPAVNAAISSCPSTSNCIVQLRPGTYRIKSTITVANAGGLTLAGYGNGATTLLLDDTGLAGADGIDFIDTWNCWLKDLTIDAPSKRTSGYAIKIAGAGGPAIIDVLPATNFHAWAVNLHNQFNGYLFTDDGAGIGVFQSYVDYGQWSEFGTNGNGATIATNHGASNFFSHLWISNDALVSSGIGALRAGLAFLVTNTGDWTLDDVETWGIQSVVINPGAGQTVDATHWNNDYFDYSPTTPVVIQSSGGTVTQFQASNTWFAGNGAPSNVVINGATEAIFTGCRFYFAQTGVTVTNGTGITFTGNQFQGNTSNGLVISAGSHINVTGNKFSTPGYGVQVAVGVANFTIVGNDLAASLGIQNNGNSPYTIAANLPDTTMLPSTVAVDSADTAPGYLDAKVAGQGLITTAVGTLPATAPPSTHLVLWIKASSCATSGSAITGCTDLSGHGNNFTQANPSLQPTLTASSISGHPGITFTANGQLLQNTASNIVSAGSDRYVVAILKPAATTGTFSAGGPVITFNQTAPTFVAYMGVISGLTYGYSTQAVADHMLSPPLIAGFPMMFELGGHVGGIPIYVINGSSYAASGTPVQSDTGTAGVAIGDQFGAAGAGQYFAGDIDELLVYSAILSAGDIAILRGYVAGQYPAITISGPGGLEVMNVGLTVPSGKLVGNPTASPTDGQGITVGSGLLLSPLGVLTATGAPPFIAPAQTYGGTGISSVSVNDSGQVLSANAQTFLTPTAQIGVEGDVAGLGPLVGPLRLRLTQQGAGDGQVMTWSTSLNAWHPAAAGGSDPLGYYWVSQASHAPANAFNLGSLGASGVLWCSYSSPSCTPALATSGQLVGAIAWPTGVLKWTGSALASSVIQSSGATIGGADVQGPGAYIAGLTGGGTATGPGTVPLTLHLDSGATVQGILPLGNEGAPTGSGIPTVTSGAWNGAAYAAAAAEVQYGAPSGGALAQSANLKFDGTGIEIGGVAMPATGTGLFVSESTTLANSIFRNPTASQYASLALQNDQFATGGAGVLLTGSTFSGATPASAVQLYNSLGPVILQDSTGTARLTVTGGHVRIADLTGAGTRCVQTDNLGTLALASSGCSSAVTYPTGIEIGNGTSTLSSYSAPQGQLLYGAPSGGGPTSSASLTTGLDANLHITMGDDTAPTAVTTWDGRHSVFGKAGSTGGALGASATASTSTINLLALAPGLAWWNLGLHAQTYALYSTGSTLGLFQDGSGAVYDETLTTNGLMKTTGGNGKHAIAAAGTDYVQTVGVTSPIVNTGTAANPILGLASSGVTAGSYTNTSITVGADGRVTAATSGSAGAAFYQTIENAGSVLPQHNAFNFFGGLTAVDDSGSGRTNVTANLSVGVAGGQSAIGGTSSGDALTLRSNTSNNGKINLGLAGGVAVFDEASGKASFGQVSVDGQVHIAVTNDTAPGTITTWDSRHFVVGASGGTSGGFGVSTTSATSTVNLLAVAPNTAWWNMHVDAASFGIYPNGSASPGFSQDSSGVVSIANLGAGGVVTADLTTGRLRAVPAALSYRDYYIDIPSLAAADTALRWLTTASKTQEAAGGIIEYPNQDYIVGHVAYTMDIIDSAGLASSMQCSVMRNGSAIGGTTLIFTPGATPTGLYSISSTATGSASTSDTYGMACQYNGNFSTGPFGAVIAFTVHMALQP